MKSNTDFFLIVHFPGTQRYFSKSSTVTGINHGSSRDCISNYFLGRPELRKGFRDEVRVKVKTQWVGRSLSSDSLPGLEYTLRGFSLVSPVLLLESSSTETWGH